MNKREQTEPSVNLISTTIALPVEKEQAPVQSLDPDLQSLVNACLKNDRTAQETLYKKYYGKMMGVCMRYLRNTDDAAEALNLGFLKVFQNLRKYNGQGSFEGWMYLIIRNSVIDHLRKRLKYREEGFNGNEEAYAVSEGVLQQLYAEDLMKLMQQLPEATRLVFNLFAIEGFKHEEIARELGISSGTSKWHVSEARRILKEKLETRSEAP